MNEPINVLIVDDEEFWRQNYEESILNLKIDSVRTAANLTDARQMIDEMKFAVAIIDIGLDAADESNVDGLLVMEKLLSMDDDTSIVVITGRSGSDVIDVVSKSIHKYAATATFAKGKVDPTLLQNAVTNGLQVHAGKKARKHRPAYMGIPHQFDQMIWEDLMMRMLGISEGVAVLYDFLEKLSHAYLPLVGTGEDDSLTPDPAYGLAHGAYWSRAIGRPVVITVGRKAAFDKAETTASDRRLHGQYELGEVLTDYATGKIRGVVHELSNYGRSQFSRAGA